MSLVGPVAPVSFPRAADGSVVNVRKFAPEVGVLSSKGAGAIKVSGMNKKIGARSKSGSNGKVGKVSKAAGESRGAGNLKNGNPKAKGTTETAKNFRVSDLRPAVIYSNVAKFGFPPAVVASVYSFAHHYYRIYKNFKPVLVDHIYRSEGEYFSTLANDPDREKKKLDFMMGDFVERYLGGNSKGIDIKKILECSMKNEEFKIGDRSFRLPMGVTWWSRDPQKKEVYAYSSDGKSDGVYCDPEDVKKLNGLKIHDIGPFLRSEVARCGDALHDAIVSERKNDDMIKEKEYDFCCALIRLQIASCGLPLGEKVDDNVNLWKKAYVKVKNVAKQAIMCCTPKEVGMKSLSYLGIKKENDGFSLTGTGKIEDFLKQAKGVIVGVETLRNQLLSEMKKMGESKVLFNIYESGEFDLYKVFSDAFRDGDEKKAMMEFAENLLSGGGNR